MPSIREILTDWTTPAGSTFRTVMYFNTTPTPAAQRAALQAFWQSTDGARTNQIHWTIETSGREVDVFTGILTGVWNDATARTGVGGVAGECVADATQVLVTWSTSAIVNGRFLKGHTFIPGLSSAQIVAGNTSGILRSTWDAAAATFLGSGASFGVWHRPQGGSGGSLSTPATGRTGLELAVLRRRRH